MLHMLRISALFILPSILFLFLVLQCLMISNRKPEVKLLQARLLYNPFLMQFRGKYYLTEKGIYWRNLSWVFLVIYVIGMHLTLTFL